MNPESRGDHSSTSENQSKTTHSESDRNSLGKFLIEKKIGFGGMGTVYLATDTGTKRSVALKILSRKKAENPALVKRFKAEAAAAASLKHDHITAVYDAGEIDGFLYIALEYVDGTDLQQLVNQKGRLPIERSVQMIRQVTLALQHAFERGIVHRDIKPSNLLIDRSGNVKLTDMGLARTVDEAAESGITRVGTTVGTVDYMAPEQAKDSRSADIRSDIYSLGCAWYHMLTGEPPFPKGTLTNKLFAHQSSPRPDPREIIPAIPEGIAVIIRRMMAQSPKNRYQTPEDLLDVLDQIQRKKDSDSSGFLNSLGPDVVPGETKAGNRTTRISRSSSIYRRREASAKSKKLISIVLAAVVLFATSVWGVFQFFKEPDEKQSVASTDSLENPANPSSGNALEQEPSDSGKKDPDDLKEKSPSKSRKTASNTERKSPPGTAPETPTDTLPNPENTAGIEIGRPDEREHMPPWVAEVWPAEKKGIPSQATGPVLTVGRDNGNLSQYPDLSSALTQIPASGGTVKLVGNGPFLLTPTSLDNRKEVIITATEGSRPLILLVPGRSANGNPIFRVSNGSLVLSGVHLTALSEQFTHKGRLVLVEVDSGDLAVRNCSMTVHGNRANGTIGFRVTGTRNGAEQVQSRILLDRSFFCGDGLSAIEIDQAATDLVASQCVLASGNAPVVTVTDTSRRNASSLSGDAFARTLRFYSCTVVTNRLAFEFSSGSRQVSLSDTTVHSLNSLFGVAGGKNAATLLTLLDWPEQLTLGPGRPKVNNLVWKTNRCLFLGWKDLITTQPASYNSVQGPDGWQRFWEQLVQTNQFQSYVWPGSNFENPGSLLPRFFDTETIRDKDLIPIGGAFPGCLVKELSVPRYGTIKRTVSLADRPALLRELYRKLQIENTITVDITKQDLGRVISGTNWPDGTLFLVTGSGRRSSSPIRVNNKSLRIRFQPDKGKAIVIFPKQLLVKTSINSAESEKAFLSVSRGTIEIENGAFHIPNATRNAYVRWFLFLDDGNFFIKNTYIQGPTLDHPAYKGLIRFSRSPQRHPDSSALSRYDGMGRIVDCSFISQGTLISADMHRNAILCENSLLVSRGRLFHLNLVEANRRHDAALDINQCTLSAPETIFDVTSSSFAGIKVEPLRFFVSRTVFAPGVKTVLGEPAHPALLVYPKNALSRREITWWGNANGYSDDFTVFLQSQSATQTSIQKIETNWIGAWDVERIFRPLFGTGSVRLIGEVPNSTTLTVGDFQLEAACAAARWTEDGNPIGADISVLARQVNSIFTEEINPSDQ
jgi:serine/threonine protein kinase